LSQPPVNARRILRAAPRRNILTKTLGSGVALRAGGLTGIVPYTFLYIIPIESPCLAVRLGFLNPYNAAMTIAKAKVYPTDSYSGAASALSVGNVAVVPTGAGIGSPAYFDNAGADSYLLNGAGATRSFTLPANAANAGNALAASPIQWSDWVQCVSIARADGGVQHLLMIAVTVSSTDYISAGGTFPTFNGNATANRGRLTYILTAWNNGVDYADNVAGTNWKKFGSGDQGPLFALQYVPANPGIQVVLNGDSLSAAPTNDGYSTPLHRAGWDLSSAALPIEVASLAWGGATESVYGALLETNIAGVKPSILAIQPNSRNDGATGAAGTSNQQLLARRLAAAAIAGEAHDSKLILNSGGCQPSYDGNATNQAMFLDIEARLAAMAAQAGIPFIDAPAIIGNLAGGAPWDYLGGFSDDNTHPNYAGVEALVPAAKAALQSLIY
jgi:hypothetical protein